MGAPVVHHVVPAPVGRRQATAGTKRVVRTCPAPITTPVRTHIGTTLAIGTVAVVATDARALVGTAFAIGTVAVVAPNAWPVLRIATLHLSRWHGRPSAAGAWVASVGLLQPRLSHRTAGSDQAQCHEGEKCGSANHGVPLGGTAARRRRAHMAADGLVQWKVCAAAGVPPVGRDADRRPDRADRADRADGVDTTSAD